MPFSVRPCTIVRTAASMGIGLLVSCVVSCAPGPRLLQGKYPGDSPRYHVEIDSLGRKHGLERWWHENGSLKSEGTWREGRRDGVYRGWYADGTPWYAGRDSLGIPVDTLRVWHPNGRLQGLWVFAEGNPVRTEEYDTAGQPSEATRFRLEEEAALAAAKRRADSLEAVGLSRADALRAWSDRTRAVVEAWWNLPERLKKTPRRAVARLRVARDGRILGIGWVEKSGSREFDARAARALAKAGKLPPVPEAVEAPLTLSYAFTTPGLSPPRRRLQLREPENAVEDQGLRQ